MADQNALQPVQPQTQDLVRESDKVQLVLAYLGLLALIPLLTVKDSEYVKWHARQGLALLICYVGATIGVMILSVILAFIPILGWLIIVLMYLALYGGGLALVIIGIVKALKPERWQIPIVSMVADKLLGGAK